MYIVALTGGIGTGKSAASKIFHALGASIIDTDIIARELVEPGMPSYHAIVEHFGSQILTPDKTLNRRALKTIIFNDRTERTWLENRLHPEIYALGKSRAENAKGPYSIIVIPLLFDKERFAYAQRILVIDTHEDIQAKRTMERDHISQHDFESIRNTQLGKDKRLAIADDVIENNDGPQHLEKQVNCLHQSYLKRALDHDAQ